MTTKENLIKIRDVFAIWQNDPDNDPMFEKIFNKIDSYAGAVFSIRDPKLFLKCHKEQDYEIRTNDRPGQTIYIGYARKAAEKNQAFEVIYYKNDSQMMTDVRVCLSDVRGIPEELYSLKYKHIIFIVPGTQLVMDIAVEKDLPVDE
jgi:hypothetical protein